ncbi:hypothetical protein ARMGADRAFT_281606 [Armillaria gallica]|uniref:Uncharacterized protein n=1 Tax=Armillaria gallica TaxID=47427 RepID=A0A2H3E6I8_ARMGA|nr:hypothetical protein ARMGADRAFT_281606 [Armillaria gallica]
MDSCLVIGWICMGCDQPSFPLHYLSRDLTILSLGYLLYQSSPLTRLLRGLAFSQFMFGRLPRRCWHAMLSEAVGVLSVWTTAIMHEVVVRFNDNLELGILNLDYCSPTINTASPDDGKTLATRLMSE